MHDLSRTILAALDTRRQIAPISATRPDFGLGEAYEIVDQVIAMRLARGERVAGWKIGFTNSTIWDEYGVHAPIWGPMYAAGITACDPDETAMLASLFVEPRIEPEIVFRVATTPRADMDDAELMACLDAVGHGFEVVESIFPGWKFTAADTVAAGSLHGAFVHGPLARIGPAERATWIERLKDFSIELACNGEMIDRGVAANVLGGPLSAFRHFVAGMAVRPMRRGIAPGDLVTTGTVTRAFPVKAGQRWSTTISGLAVPGLSLSFV
jgi:2-keto-4-pentenoate hydratase